MTLNNLFTLALKAAALVIVTVALLFSGGCGGGASLQTSPQLASYVAAFAAEGAARSIPVRDVIAVLDPDFRAARARKDGRLTLGSCLGGVIRIDALWWHSEITTADDKEALMFHELGHCALGLEHIEGWTTAENPDTGTPVRVPLSLMAAEFIGGYAWSLDRERYIEGLFNEAK
jgi:hypothetical protein